MVRVFKGGKVTVPKRLRELFGVEDGDYVKLALVEVLKKGDVGWVRRKVYHRAANTDASVNEKCYMKTKTKTQTFSCKPSFQGF